MIRIGVNNGNFSCKFSTSIMAPFTGHNIRHCLLCCLHRRRAMSQPRKPRIPHYVIRGHRLNVHVVIHVGRK